LNLSRSTRFFVVDPLQGMSLSKMVLLSHPLELDRIALSTVLRSFASAEVDQPDSLDELIFKFGIVKATGDDIDRRNASIRLNAEVDSRLSECERRTRALPIR
jgi:hypothetical protein